MTREPASERVHRGSVRGLRTFRLGSAGELLPISSRSKHPLAAWEPGVTTATCSRWRAAGILGGSWHRPLRSIGHAAPGEGCTCGLWAFGSLEALRASMYGDQRRVIAVVSCRGRLIPGEVGFRAEHGEIAALWLAPDLPADTVERVARRYPQAALFRSVQAMLAEYPLTVLPSYRMRRPWANATRWVGLAGLTAAVAALAAHLWQPLLQAPPTAPPGAAGMALAAVPALVLVSTFPALLEGRRCRHMAIALAVGVIALVAAALAPNPLLLPSALSAAFIACVSSLVFIPVGSVLRRLTWQQWGRRRR